MLYISGERHLQKARPAHRTGRNRETMMGCWSVCTKLQMQPLLLANQPETRTTQAFQLGVNKKTCVSYVKVKPHHHHYYSTSSFHCRSHLSSEEIAPVASATYGVLLLGGGLFAYTRTESKGSLLGGLTGAALMGAAYFLMLAPDTKDLGEALAFGSALLFSSVFGIRLAATRKIVPAGPLLALSLGALVLFLSAYLQETV